MEPTHVLQTFPVIKSISVKCMNEWVGCWWTYNPDLQDVKYYSVNSHYAPPSNVTNSWQGVATMFPSYNFHEVHLFEYLLSETWNEGLKQLGIWLNGLDHFCFLPLAYLEIGNAGHLLMKEDFVWLLFIFWCGARQQIYVSCQSASVTSFIMYGQQFWYFPLFFQNLIFCMVWLLVGSYSLLTW